jgi:hypothetical protein
MQRFEICDFVCKKVCKRWHCARDGPSFYKTRLLRWELTPSLTSTPPLYTTSWVSLTLASRDAHPPFTLPGLLHETLALHPLFGCFNVACYGPQKGTPPRPLSPLKGSVSYDHVLQKVVKDRSTLHQ